MNVRIVESVHSFESAAQARAWALANVRGHSAVNKQTAMVIRIGRRALEKTTSESSVLKSSNRAAHLAAVSVLIPLLEEAVLFETHCDRYGDPNIRQIHRFYAALSNCGEGFRVKLTVKEFAQRVEGTVFYTYGLAQIEMPIGKQAASCPEEQTSAPPTGIITLTDLFGGASGKH